MKARLVLSDGTHFEGTFFGASRIIGGEVVFNTAMTGYAETLTDPSYAGQILVATYPLIGNYGVPMPRPPRSLAGPYESHKIQVQGLIVQTYVDDFSHHEAARSLRQWLLEEEVPAVSGIDTRALTRHLREKGTMHAWVFPADTTLEQAKTSASTVDMRHEVFSRVAPAEVVTYGDGDVTVLLVDAGAKDNLVRSLVERRVRVIRAPWHASLLPLAERSDGILIGNGPGDPRDLRIARRPGSRPLGRGGHPIFGVCLGNQILALAAGGDTYKLPYGHRGVNQPVQDLLTGRCYVTSQNHGYAVKEDSLPSDWEPWFVNIERRHERGNPVAQHAVFQRAVSSRSASWPGGHGRILFDDFLRLAGAMRKRSMYGAYLPRKPRRVLVLGSGALQIGQAGEFDYSGSQALKALREEGICTVLVNPNIATIQTRRRPCRPGVLRRRHARVRRAHHRQGGGRRDPAVLRRPDRAQLRPRARTMRASSTATACACSARRSRPIRDTEDRRAVRRSVWRRSASRPRAAALARSPDGGARGGDRRSASR